MRGRVVGGDWDLHAKPFHPWDVNKALNARFVEGAAWQSTDLYKRVCSDISRGHVRWGCRTKQQFEQRLQSLDVLYETIRRDGYRSQQELIGEVDQASWEARSPFKKFDEIVVCVDRDGCLLLRDGKHRLAIAKILDLPFIPVAIGLRHSSWTASSDGLANLVIDAGGANGKCFTHPDLLHLNLEKDDGRLSWIESALHKNVATVLDAGRSFGYFGRRLERLGYATAVAVVELEDLPYTQILRDAEHGNYNILPLSTYCEGPTTSFDVVIAIDVLNNGYYNRGDAESKKRLKQLASLSRRQLFVELATDEIGDDLADLASTGGFSDIRYLGASCGGGLYVLQKAQEAASLQ